MSTKQRMRNVQAFAERVSAQKVDATRHKCFVSYHLADIDEVTTFLDDFATEFIPRSVGVTEEDDFVDSTDNEYIKRRIREEYLTDSTVTIVLLGGCTWARKFVDWNCPRPCATTPRIAAADCSQSRCRRATTRPRFQTV